jgi:hypothetical protein
MEARITRLEQLVSELRGDVIELQTAEQIAAYRRQKSVDALDVLNHALYAILMIVVGVFLGIAIAIDPDRVSEATQPVHSKHQPADVPPKSPPDVELAEPL